MKNLSHIVIACIALAASAYMMYPAWISGSEQIADNNGLLTQDILGNGDEIILPIPQTLPLDPQKVALGEQLFGDTTLSGNGFSCDTCHPVDNGGMDGLQLSIVTDGGFDVMNTPTVFNSGFNAFQLWNGNAESLEEQLDGVINNPLHMDSSWPTVFARVNGNPQYQLSFSNIYPDGVTRQNIIDAITTFERSLITPNADFDRFLNGERDAISAQQKKGFELFQQYGCSSCHQGINVGGNLFARFGIFERGLTEKKQLNDFDYGRFALTQAKKDRFVFRVPSLRNVARTAPYFHDGSVPTLKQAIKIMARIQLDLELADEDLLAIEAFLHSLSGEYQGAKL